MNLAGAQGISYAIRGDATQLRQALREAASDTRAFGQTIQSALVGPAQAAAAAQAQITTAAATTAAALRAQAAAATQAGGTVAASAFSAGAALGRQAAAAVTAGAAQEAAASRIIVSEHRAETARINALTRQAAMQGAAAAATETAAARTIAARAAETAALARQTDALTRATAEQRRLAAAAASTQGSMGAMGASGVASLSTMSGILSHLVGPLGFAALIAMIAKTGVGFNDFMARQEIAFTTMLGSASGAKEFLSDMLAFAKTTPFSFPELTASAQKMVAFGIESSKVVDIMRTLGDATVGSGGSMAELQGLGIVLGQVSAKGRLMGQELLQFAERGIPALTVLANKSNMSVADFQDKVSKGQVRSEEAITNLIDGLREGTSGINGTTAAYDGLMAKVKESNIFSSAFDSFKSGFRTMSAELTESLTPALVGLVNIGGDAMGAVKGIAAAFNSMSGPVQSVAIAIAAVSIAGLLLGNRIRGGVVTAFATWNMQMQASRATMQAMGVQIGTLRAAAMSARVGIAGMGSSLMGAFGGPAGLAVTAGIALVTSLFAMNAQASAQAKADAEALKATLDETTGAITDGTEAWIRDALVKERSDGSGIFGIGDKKSTMLEDADEMGIAMTTLYEAMTGDPEALALAREQLKEFTSGLDITKESDKGRVEMANRLRDELLAQEKELENAERIAAIKQGIKDENADVQTMSQLADAYRDATYALHGFTEEQDKAIASAAEAAGKAFDSAFATVNSFKAVVITEEQLADARAKVTDATSSLRQAEDTQDRNSGRRKTTSADRKKAADDVAKAIRNQSDAQKELTELEAKDIPIGDQMMEHYRKTLEDAQKFAGDIEALSSAGLDPALINDLTIMGPEQAAPQLQELLGANGAALIELANQTEAELNGLNMRVVENARLTAIAMQSDLASTAADLPTAMKIAAAQDGRGSVSAANLSTLLGIPEGEVERIAASFGQDWVKGRDEYLEQNPMKTGSMTIPGQAPKVDVAPDPVLIDGWDTSLTNGMTSYIEAQTLTPTVTVKPTFSFIDDALAFGARAAGGRPKTGSMTIPGYYTGGIYPGYTPGRDTGYIGVGGGEAIMRPEWTRAMGPDYVHTMNALARGGGVNAVRKAMAGTGYMGAFAGGGIAGGSQWSPSSAPQIIEVPVTQRVEHHGVQTFGDIYTADAADFHRQVRNGRRNSFTGGRR